MKIQILGTGCPKCKKLYEETTKAVAAAGVDATVEKVEDIARIVEFNVMMTPALAIDGVVRSSGRIPGQPEIVSWIREAATKAG